GRTQRRARERLVDILANGRALGERATVVDERGHLAARVDRQICRSQMLECDPVELPLDERNSLLDERQKDSAGVSAERLEEVELDRHSPSVDMSSSVCAVEVTRSCGARQARRRARAARARDVPLADRASLRRPAPGRLVMNSSPRRKQRRAKRRCNWQGGVSTELCTVSVDNSTASVADAQPPTRASGPLSRPYGGRFA